MEMACRSMTLEADVGDVATAIRIYAVVSATVERAADDAAP